MSPPPAKKVKTGENSNGVGVGDGVSNNSVRRKVLVQTGQRGFLATCNFQLNPCIREAYNILAHYGAFVNGSVSEVPDTSDINALQQLQADDISDELQREINAAQQQSHQPAKALYLALETGAQNTVFIRSSISDPVKLGSFIVRDIFNTKCQRTRALIRLIPIEVVCSASNIEAIVNAVGPIFQKYFVNKPCSYSIVVNRRLNNSIERSDIIRQLAGLVRQKNAKNRVDLSTPEKTVVVEIIKGTCMIGVLPFYFKYKKYNLIECARSDNTGPKTSTVYPLIAPNAGIMVPETEDSPESPVDCVPDEAIEEPMVGPIDEPEVTEDEAKPVVKMSCEDIMRSDDEVDDDSSDDVAVEATFEKPEEDKLADSHAIPTETNKEHEEKANEEAADEASDDNEEEADEEATDEASDDNEEEADAEATDEASDDNEEEAKEEAADSDAALNEACDDNDDDEEGEEEGEEQNEADSTTIPIETSENDAQSDEDNGEQVTEGKTDDNGADETLVE